MKNKEETKSVRITFTNGYNFILSGKDLKERLDKLLETWSHSSILTVDKIEKVE